MKRVIPVLVLCAVVFPSAIAAQSSMGGGATAGLERLEAERFRQRQLAAEIAAREREYQLQREALALEAKRIEAATAATAPIELPPITEAEYQAAGLHKLTADERRALFAWLGRASTGSSSPLLARPIAAPAHPVAAEIDGNFEGFEYGKVFQLSNGEVWRQTSATYTYHYAFRPNVIIYQQAGSMSYKMRVDGVRGDVSVERLK